MNRKGKLSSLLMQPIPDPKKIVEYGRSKRLDPDELITISVKYSSMVEELGSDLNPLHVACIRSKPDIVSAIIHEGYDVNAEIGRIDSYLRIALDFGNISVARLLLELGADAKAFNSDGKTPIEAALSKNKKERACVNAVKVLLEAGVSVNACASAISHETPLHIAVNNRLPSVVSCLLQKGADANIGDGHGTTPLHYACYQNQVDIIKLLTLHKVDLYKENVILDSPLLIVVRGYFKEALNALIKGGCDINRVMAHGAITVIHVAVKECNLERVKYLVSLGADPNKQLVSGSTPLHILAGRMKSQDVAVETTKSQASIRIADYLVEMGANLNATDCNKSTPLQIAVTKKDFKLAKHFIKLGANLNLRISSKKKILFHDIASSNHDITILFLEFGADYSKKNKAGLTPYHVAIISKVNLKFIKSFVQFGCPYNQDVSVWKKSKVHGSGEFSKFFQAEEHFFKGIRENNLELVKKAVEDGAVATGCSEECRYPLHFAAFHSYKELLIYLLENTFPVNTVNDAGETALFVAAKRGHYGICCTLLQFGACYNYCSKKCSKTPKMIAREFGHKSIVDLFERVARLFYFARIGSIFVVKGLVQSICRSHGEYLMFANAINVRQDTLLATSLCFNHIKNAKEIMKLRNISSIFKNK